jgi:hypothetical protein
MHMQPYISVRIQDENIRAQIREREREKKNKSDNESVRLSMTVGKIHNEGAGERANMNQCVCMSV